MFESSQTGTNFERPFIRMGEHLIPVARIISVDFVPKGIVKVFDDDFVIYQQDTSQPGLFNDINGKEIATPILTVNYVNEKNEPDYVRRHGNQAANIWHYMTTFLTL